MKVENAAGIPVDDGVARVFAVSFGMVLGVALLKFGNPAVLEKLVEWPVNGYEVLVGPWPVIIGYWLLAVAAVVGIVVARREANAPRWLLLMPLVWLGWQFVAATQTVDAQLTRVTLKHFTACVVCFYLGCFSLARLRNPAFFLFPLVGGFVVVVAVGLQQHFGGLEATRNYFFTHELPRLQNVPPEYLKKISSDRIFSTLFYPNTLAGVLLLLLPVNVVAIWRSAHWLTAAARAFLIAVTGVSALACLYWSGSKGGWLLMLLIGLMALLRLRFSTRLKLVIVAMVLVSGLVGFAWKYAAFFQRGATSVSARFDYWQAACRTMAANPLLGTGPGTFAIPYQKIKRPESEMARLAHNDYLQQASDSGLVGFLAYTVLIAGTLFVARPAASSAGDGLRFAVWLGLLGWSLQSVLEFGLYIPALAWCGFGWMGWLLGCSAKPIDKSSPTR